ncbi:MAG TPA: hypothetical protein VHT05_09025 [Candidatus Elarobacter sp.]|nr:hypothetical protein [Candidatus Elarobacter sp.]
MQPGVATAEFPQAPGNAIPEEILARWSWGPFFLWLFWVWWNADQRFKIAAAVIFVCNFIPFVNFISGIAALALAIYLGLKGNRIMAANRSFPGGVEQFVAVQTAWARWGIIMLCVSVVLMVLGFILMGAAMMAGGMHRSY